MTDANNTTDLNAAASTETLPKADAAAKKGKTTKAKAKKPAKQAKATKAKSGAAKPTPVSILAKEMKLAPKLLRAKLRRAGLRAPYTSIQKLRAALAKADAK